MQFSKLPQQIDEGAFSKGIGERGVEGKSRMIFGEDSNPFLSHPNWDQINLIKDENEMLMRFLFGQKLLHVVRSSTEGISRVENLNNDVGRVDHFIQFVPNTARLALRKHVVPFLVFDSAVIANDITVIIYRVGF